MSKITFRADDELVERLEAHDASKSEVLRAALRAYLDGPEREPDPQATGDTGGSTASELGELLDRVLEQRLQELLETEQRDTRRPADERQPESTRQGGSAAAQQGRSTESRRGPPADRRPAARGRRDPAVVVEITPQAPGTEVVYGAVEHTTPPTDGGARRPSDTRRGRPPADEEPASDTDGRRASDTQQSGVSDTGRRDASDTDHEADGGPTADASHTAGQASDTGEDRPCARCGTALSDDHVYCPNCGEKAARRLFCDCGDEVRSDWSFCPGCGRRTPAADVLTQDGDRA